MSRLRALAALLTLAAVGGLAAWVLGPGGDGPDANEPDAPTSAARPPTAPDASDVLAAAPARAPTAPPVRRVTVRLDEALARDVADVAFVRDAAASPATDLGRFERRSERAFVCDGPRLGLPTAAAPEVVVRRGDGTAVRVAVPVPRTRAGGWAERFDTVVEVRADALATVTGRVLTSERAPAPDTWVELWSTDAPGGDGGVVRVRTDADGTYRLAVALRAARSRETRTARVTSALGWAEDLEVTLEAGRSVTVADLVLEAGHVIRGRVRQDDRTPAYQFVAAWPLRPSPPDDGNGGHRLWPTPHVEPDADGVFTLRGLPVGPVIVIAALEVGPFTNLHPDVTASLDDTVDAPAADVVVGARCRVLTFVAEDDEGRLDEFELAIEGRVGTLHLRATPDRELDVVVPVEPALRVTVRAAGHVPLEATLDASDAADPVRLRLVADPARAGATGPLAGLLERLGPSLLVACGEGGDGQLVSTIGAAVRRPGTAAAPVEFASPTPRGLAVFRDAVPPAGARLVVRDGALPMRLEVVRAGFTPQTVELDAGASPQRPTVVHLRRR